MSFIFTVHHTIVSFNLSKLYTTENLSDPLSREYYAKPLSLKCKGMTDRINHKPHIPSQGDHNLFKKFK